MKVVRNEGMEVVRNERMEVVRNERMQVEKRERGACKNGVREGEWQEKGGMLVLVVVGG